MNIATQWMEYVHAGRQLGVVCAMGVFMAATLRAAPPEQWESRGPGGGGAFFAPTVNPFNPAEIWVGSDMSDLFVSRNFGRTWDTVDFRILQGGSKPGRMLFTSDPRVRYALDESVPMRSTDHGTNWTTVPVDVWSPAVDGLWVDPATTNRLLAADYTTLYFSSNSGNTWRGVYTNNDQLIAGVFWDGERISVGTRAGLLVSTNAGALFRMASHPEIPSSEALISFVGAKDPTGGVRFLCVTWGDGDVYPGVQGSSYDSYQKIYRLDGGTGLWTVVTNGIGDNQLFQVAMISTNIGLAYAAGSDGAGQPSVVKTTNGGASWTQVLRCSGNENVATGWSGDDPGGWNWKKWSFGECAMGFAVCATDPNRAVVTDFGFIHVTTNGGATWRQAYVVEDGENPVGEATPKTNFYCGNGLEDTSCWGLSWFDSNTIFASFTDVRGMWSTNGGQSWMSPLSLTFNSTYATVRHPDSGAVYGAMSSVHDIYAWDTYCMDARLDVGSGAVMGSSDKGATWSTFKNFGRPVVHVALDVNHPNWLYAAMVHSVSGGIYRTTNLSAGISATWTKLGTPPRTAGHPYNMYVLNDGTLVATYSARIVSNDFQASSGVFVSTNDGASWVDRTDVAMRYYTKDLAVDPHDPAQNVWYAGVWGEWGASADKGGLYRTTNRGMAWTRITTNLKAVGSATLSPSNPDEMYVTTEDQGLWYSANRRAASPTFVSLDYPFRFPTRVFFNSYDTNAVWVTSFGNGMRVGRLDNRAPAWDAGFADIGGGWRRLTWFGDYVPMGDAGWIWHNKHGFLYPTSASTSDDIWFYTNDLGWLWTSSTTYPFLYRASPAAWLWYNGATNPRWFRNMTAGTWEWVNP